MKLPTIPYADGTIPQVQAAFEGLDYRYNAGNGAIVEEVNCSSAFYPALASRPARRPTDAGTVSHPNGLAVLGSEPNEAGYAGGHHYIVAGNQIYRNGLNPLTLQDGPDAASWLTRRRTLVGMGRRLIVFPDKLVIDTTDWTGASPVKKLAAAAGGNGLVFRDGSLFGEDAAANTIYAAGIEWSDYFSAGDAVTVALPETQEGADFAAWNGTFIVREIDGHELRFSENSFEPPEGVTLPVTVGGWVDVARRVPDLDYLCEQGNRLWGCRGDTIYCSKLGDPFNWFVYDGLATDSWTVETGSPGSFTGCVSFLGYPIFFKADAVYKIYGTRPENFDLVGGPSLGVRPGCGRSLAAAGDVLYYVSRVGLTAYTGGLPRQATELFGGRRLTDAVAGSDGRLYYLSARDSTTGVWSQWVYDTRTGLLSREEETWRDEWDSAPAGHSDLRAVGFGYYNGGLIRLLRNGESWYTGEDRDDEDEEPAWCMAEFGELDYVRLSYRGGAAFTAMIPVRMWVRCAAPKGVTLTVFLRYDGGSWEQAAQITGSGEREDAVLPIMLRRCRRYAMKLVTTGPFRLLAIERELTASQKALK